MKSAKEWAAQASATATAEDVPQGVILYELEQMFKEHARDQRNLCGRAVETEGPLPSLSRRHAQTLAVNAPAPGES